VASAMLWKLRHFAVLGIGDLHHQHRQECLYYCKTGTLRIAYFLETAPGAAILASRRNRADSSGGVGLM